jgi:dinuclear metal center YbgI/SA1388 family protein
MQVGPIVQLLRTLSPEHLAESWDRVGLQVGDPAWSVKRAMLCIDLTERVLDEAIGKRVSLIVAYHPLIFQPLAALTPADPKQGLILRAVRERIAVYSPHTALDAAEGGLNDWLCDGLGAGRRRPIRPTGAAKVHGYKLVTFVPSEHLDALRAALAGAGAGGIGDYSDCSFAVAGEGTFRGGATTHPRVGRRGRFERVRELRLEMVCPAHRLVEVVAALRGAHPYEEPAFDIYRLEPPDLKAASTATGLGRWVELDRPIAPKSLVRLVKRRLGADRLEVSIPQSLKQVQHLGVCVGAGGALLPPAHAGGLEAFITGEMRHHDVLAAQQRGVMVVLAGHTQTERPYLPVYRKRILVSGGGGVEWLISKADRAPLRAG